MKHIVVLCISFLFLFINFQLQAQQTEYYENIQKNIDVAKQLFDDAKYVAAFREFEIVRKSVDETSELYSEAEYYKAVSALNAGFEAGSKLIKKFLKEHSDSPYVNSAKFNYGNYQFEKKQYLPALRTFAGVNRDDLSDKERIKIEYRTGYCYLMTDQTDKAKKEFFGIKDANNLYSIPATYYWAHIMYLEDNYDEALQGFRKLENYPEYSRLIPMYVSHIYYKQQKYSEVISYTVPIIDEVEKEHKPELSKIIGDSYFHLAEYEKAIPFLETYFETKGPKTREENYILGYCYYITGNIEKAQPLLKNATKGKDKLAQNAYYHLADCYIKTDEKEKAKLAYNAAAEFDFDEKIKEDALFNYAKLTYELSYSPFNETIKAFDDYISLYPDSKRNAEAYSILTDVYMVTRNYKDAIESIEKIDVKTPKILHAYQRVTFFRGLELFNNSNYKEAIGFFDISLENGSYDKELKARALYWKAEALYRTGDYNGAVSFYKSFLQSPGAKNTKEYNGANYNIGYAYFKLSDYDSAFRHFRKFIDNDKNKGSGKIADAYNRLGDYYFLKTDYAKAVDCYTHTLSMNIYEADYALFQIAFCKGLQRNQQAKIASLETLLAKYPDSDYRDDALYELGRAYERTGESSKAKTEYDALIRNFPQSGYYRKALLQLGLINFNEGNFNKAMKLYKQVAENYAGTPEAKAALPGIKNCYVETNNIDGYFSYVKRLGSGVVVTVSEQDSLTYMAAERVYMAGGDAIPQLQKYLKKFPDGAFKLNANFYLAEQYYKKGKYSLARQCYNYVAQQPQNIFSEPALSRASELAFTAGSYMYALDLFNKLEKNASGKWNVLKANTGQMRCNFILEKYSDAIAAAKKVKESEIAGENLIREANFTEGKSYYKLNKPDKAVPALKAAAVDAKTEQGAEAKYLLSEIYYRQKKLKKAEDEINDFIAQESPFQYWLGKAFLLMTDIYHDKGDDFTAKHTLKSIVENYGNDTDGIKAEAAKKLKVIEEREAADEKNAIDSSFQMEIKQN